jgi:hypothetical protein
MQLLETASQGSRRLNVYAELTVSIQTGSLFPSPIQTASLPDIALAAPNILGLHRLRIPESAAEYVRSLTRL